MANLMQQLLDCYSSVAKDELEKQGCRIYQDTDDGLYGIYKDETDQFIVDSYCETKEIALIKYFALPSN